MPLFEHKFAQKAAYRFLLNDKKTQDTEETLSYIFTNLVGTLYPVVVEGMTK